MRKLILAACAAIVAMPVAPLMADPPHRPPPRDYHHDHNDHRPPPKRYDSHGRYTTPQRVSRNDHVWYRNGHYYCRRDNGTTGLLVGGALGALLGNQLAGGGEKTLGTLLGAAGGAALGKAIDEGDIKCQ